MLPHLVKEAGIGWLQSWLMDGGAGGYGAARSTISASRPRTRVHLLGCSGMDGSRLLSLPRPLRRGGIPSCALRMPAGNDDGEKLTLRFHLLIARSFRLNTHDLSVGSLLNRSARAVIISGRISAQLHLPGTQLSPADPAGY